MKVIEIEGNADDLYVNEKQMKSVSAVQLSEDGVCHELTLTSVIDEELDPESTEHKVIDGLLGHKLRFTVEVID